ncbi:DNA polymerase III subunit delta [Novosphingobium mangrovi (ex Huang et al. 2023)]|uniref:DNA-directed DNA polymerase n=1 Tax=Novosphingobium mangrovi (ex Huang et al. 2023) TaxID=2976432 RepID=A0ABT2I9U6_9SPHN|nr:DNA polymerase III subunit delta [Novosphingobium mangrovi (ex Huang et al. 2023)]MCT2401604.1 DNA polymerase III subunit delta [Novosphingobium mangrovi (ex Huang et al. 2023)]
MKATQKDFAGLAARAAQQARVFFFCGPDESGAADAAARIVSLLPDPGERVEIGGSDVRKDPVRLGDEARSTSLFGGSRHIWVRAQGDEAHDAVKTLLDNAVEACPVLILATGATDKSRTAKLLANRDDGLVAMFYPPDLGSVTASVRTMANSAGLKLGSDIAERIARGSGLDTRIARSEVAKLALYLDAMPETPRPVSVADLDAVGAQTEDDGFAPLVDAVLGGRREAIAPELRRMHELGLNPVGLLLAFERRVAQLAALNARLGRSPDVAGFLKAEAGARRVFWKDQPALAVQLKIWRGPRLERLVARLVALHQSLMANSQDSELLLAEGLLTIARIACSKVTQPANRAV